MIVGIVCILLFLAIQSWAIYYMLHVYSTELNQALEKIEKKLSHPLYIHEEVPDVTFYGQESEARERLEMDEDLDIDKLFADEYNEELKIATR